MAHETFLNTVQTTKAITIITAAKTIRKVLGSSAMGLPFFLTPGQCAHSGYSPRQIDFGLCCTNCWLDRHRRCGLLVARKLVPDVRFGSKADIRSAKSLCPLYPRKRTCAAHEPMYAKCQKRTLARLFDDLVGASDECVRDVNAQCLGSLEVDGQLDLGYLLDRQVGGLLALEDAASIDTSLPV